MIDARFVYLPRPNKLGDETCRFRSSYSQTLRLLEKELNHLGAAAVVVQAGYRLVRNDGWPFSNAKPDHPAVILQFQTGRDTLTFRAATYTSFDDNLRAIAMTLSALRAIDRYGVVQGQQYAGFKQLGSPPPDQPMTKHQAFAWLSFTSGHTDLHSSREKLDAAYRQACKANHPDTGGSHEQFLKVQEAYRILKEGLI